MGWRLHHQEPVGFILQCHHFENTENNTENNNSNSEETNQNIDDVILNTSNLYIYWD